jgi:hypothetical protein
VGIDRILTVGIGWHLDVDQTRAFFESFKRVTKEKTSHMEDRFHTATGVKLTPVEVVDQEEEVGWIVDNKVFDSPWPEFLYEINSLVEGYHFDLVNGSMLLILIDAPSLEKDKTYIDVKEDDYLGFQLPQNVFTLLDIARNECRGWLPGVELGTPEIIGAINCS